MMTNASAGMAYRTPQNRSSRALRWRRGGAYGLDRVIPALPFVSGAGSVSLRLCAAELGLRGAHDGLCGHAACEEQVEVLVHVQGHAVGQHAVEQLQMAGLIEVGGDKLHHRVADVAAGCDV